MESLEGLFLGLIWWSGWKVSKTHFLGQNWAQEPQNCPKSISRELLVVESWLTPQNDRKTWFTMGSLRYEYLSDYWKCPKDCMIFHKSWTARRIKLVDPSKWPQEWINDGCSEICLPLFLFFSGLIWWNFKSFHIRRTIYHIKLAGISKWLKDPSLY